MTRRRLPLIAFLGINVAVSIVATLTVLFIWGAGRQPQTLVVPPTFSPVSAAGNGPPAASADGSAGQGQPPSAANGAQSANNGSSAAPQVTTAPASDIVIHVVQEGDVMGAIAEQYDVSVEDIVIVNELESADFLDVGQQLIIPVGGLPPTPTLTPTLPQPTPTIELEPIATITPLPPGTISVVIQDVLFPGDVTSEAVVIFNAGTALDMEGWLLSDEQGNEFIFPSFRLFGNGTSVSVHTGVGQATASDLYWGLSSAVWGESSDTAILRDPTGTLQSEFRIEQ